MIYHTHSWFINIEVTNKIWYIGQLRGNTVENSVCFSFRMCWKSICEFVCTKPFSSLSLSLPFSCSIYLSPSLLPSILSLYLSVFSLSASSLPPLPDHTPPLCIPFPIYPSLSPPTSLSPSPSSLLSLSLFPSACDHRWVSISDCDMSGIYAYVRCACVFARTRVSVCLFRRSMPSPSFFQFHFES